MNFIMFIEQAGVYLLRPVLLSHSSIILCVNGHCLAEHIGCAADIKKDFDGGRKLQV